MKWSQQKFIFPLLFKITPCISCSLQILESMQGVTEIGYSQLALWFSQWARMSLFLFTLQSEWEFLPWGDLGGPFHFTSSCFLFPLLIVIYLFIWKGTGTSFFFSCQCLQIFPFHCNSKYTYRAAVIFRLHFQNSWRNLWMIYFYKSKLPVVLLIVIAIAGQLNSCWLLFRISLLKNNYFMFFRI